MIYINKATVTPKECCDNLLKETVANADLIKVPKGEAIRLKITG